MRCTEWFSGRGADEPPALAPAQAPRPTVLAWRIWAFGIPALIVLALACFGCAAERFLTQEQDAELGRFCARPGGCAVVPADQWRAIRELLERLGIKPEDPV